uniref:Uncharacterized protein n=1 Tax=Anopheles atroparvus TaxID=41427 RepID=A0AAG5DD12_ANOAO
SAAEIHAARSEVSPPQLFLSHPTLSSRCRLLGLNNVQTRHSHAQSLFIASILLHNLDAPLLLSSLPLYVPSRRLRDRPPLRIPTRLTRYGRNDPLLRAMDAFNAASCLFDYNIAISQFRSRLVSVSSSVLPSTP